MLHPSRTLGRTGLKVSPLAFGVGTFGSKWGEGWSIDKTDAEAIFNRFLDGGMNHIDAADTYQGGESEAWIGEFLRNRGNRDRVVVATKATMNTDPDDLNGGGNSRKNLVGSLEGSLRRLKTDYVDLFYAHHWDTVTPVEELMSTFDQLVRSGKTRYVGLSNFPGWYLGEAGVLGRWHGWEPIAAIQMEYNLLERTIEREFIPYALRTGLGVLAWSPLANGLLTGRYEIDAANREIKGQGRITKSFVTDPFVDAFSKQSQGTLETLKAISTELEATPAQVALAWMLRQPGLTGIVTGASKVSQVESNLAALDLELTDDQLDRLDNASTPSPSNPYSFHSGPVQDAIHGGGKIGD
ncbi:MAG: aldo/keto reductase [Cyanobacteria bacterium P01_D01_bin.71]